MNRLVRVPREPGLDRRASIRFPLALELRYTVSRRHAPVVTGVGRLIDLSSSGLRFVGQGLWILEKNSMWQSTGLFYWMSASNCN